ncbi:DUF5953 family protein [Corallococcus macrosporus]|uniref:DUF5953 family protein n=1 Tax=Corallococcus macrosporus TaxID=35 RepID=UPI003B832F88
MPRHVARGTLPLLCSGDGCCPVTISGRRCSASASPLGQPQLQVHAKLPLDGAVVTAAADVLAVIRRRARWRRSSTAGWGRAMPTARRRRRRSCTTWRSGPTR